MRIFNAYGALLCAVTERKTERELARARISVVSSQQHDKQQQGREERTCLVHASFIPRARILHVTTMIGRNLGNGTVAT